MEHLEDSELRQLYADPAAAAQQARDKAAAARVWLMKHKPFFGVLARALRLEASLATPALRLLPDDRLLFHPIVVLQMRFPTLCARLAHVAMHAALSAFGRRRGREERRWNVAHDLAIGPLLDAAELSVGRGGTAGLDLPAGASAEAYYDTLPEGVEPDPHWCDLCDPLPDDEVERAPPAGRYQTEGEAVPTLDERGAELSWKIRLGAALEEEQASGGLTFGDLPDWLEEMVRASIEPPVDWSATLQEAVHALQRIERTYLRPSRRMAALAGIDAPWPDVVTMPGRRVTSAGRLVAVVDTSASIAVPTLGRFLGTVAAVATAEGVDEVRLLHADAAVNRDETIETARLYFQEIAMTGRGGTDFGPALRQLEAESRRRRERFTVIYLTDLDGRFPAPAEVATLEVLWVVPRKVAAPPPFGRVVQMAER